MTHSRCLYHPDLHLLPRERTAPNVATGDWEVLSVLACPHDHCDYDKVAGVKRVLDDEEIERRGLPRLPARSSP